MNISSYNNDDIFRNTAGHRFSCNITQKIIKTTNKLTSGHSVFLNRHFQFSLYFRSGSQRKIGDVHALLSFFDRQLVVFLLIPCYIKFSKYITFGSLQIRKSLKDSDFNFNFNKMMKFILTKFRHGYEAGGRRGHAQKTFDFLVLKNKNFTLNL